MEPGTTAIERAFELARGGTCATVAEIRKRLSQEGYAQSQIEGQALAKQLRALILESGGKAPKA
jgi:hypothetical protein